VKLTPATIRTLTLPPGVTDKVFFDEDLPGFGLRMRASGVHSWMIQYAIARRTRRVVLGLATALAPSRARAIAETLLAQVRLGRDPAGEKHQAKAAAAETFGALLPHFLERQKARLKPRSYVEIERHLTMYAKPLHGSPIEAITKRTIATRLAEIEKRSGGVTRNRVRASLSGYFTWLAREGYLDANPVTFTNKADENGGCERVLSDEELRIIWRTLDDGPPDQFGAIVKLLILTGARRTEIGGLEEDEISPTLPLITLPPARTKNGREHLIPLSEPALNILKTLPRRAMADGSPQEHVFGNGQGYQNYSRAKAELDARIAKAGHRLAPWTLHDFRRSLSTALHDRFGILPHVVEVILGHAGGHKSGVAGVYNKALYLEERRRALERWGVHIMGVVTGKPVKAKVVKLKRALEGA
jgi:integrase